MANPTPPPDSAQPQFDPWEHLQDVLRRVFKKEVLEEFKDIQDDDFKDISTARRSLKTACLPDDNDTSAMLTLRMMLFYIVLRRAQDMQAPLIGMPYWDAGVDRKHKPQVILHFSQDRSELKNPGDIPVTGRISFRLMNETTQSISEAKLKVIAQRIKTSFNSDAESKWYRGRNMGVYHAPDQGMGFKIQTDTKAHALDLVKTICLIAGEIFNGEYFRYSTPDDPTASYPANPGNQTIMGKVYKKPIRRQICTVRFRYAVAIIHGRPTPIPLFDKSGKFIAPLVDQF
jgi:hypothetical protein